MPVNHLAARPRVTPLPGFSALPMTRTGGAAALPSWQTGKAGEILRGTRAPHDGDRPGYRETAPGATLSGVVSLSGQRQICVPVGIWHTDLAWIFSVAAACPSWRPALALLSVNERICR